MPIALQQSSPLDAVEVPQSALTRQIVEFIRDTETDLLFNHSSRVYYFGALAGARRGLKFDRELLYAGAMFHDIGLIPAYSSPTNRFEVDGANAARSFLEQHGISAADIDHVWTAIALHTTPGIPKHMHPVVALVTAAWKWTFWGLHTTPLRTPRETKWSGASQEPHTSRKTSCRPFTMGLSTSQRQRSEM